MGPAAPGAESEADPFWERPDIVDRFAHRDPDLRLRRMVEEEGLGRSLDFRVLDLGCAGGRNTVYLAEIGVDIHALDAAEAMVKRTRRRLADVLGSAEARRRVRRGIMTDLSMFGDDHFHLVVALGVLQTASSMEEWSTAVSQIRRILRPPGRLLVSNFSSESEPKGRPLEPVEGCPHLYRWRHDRPMVLMDPRAHDAAFRLHGFRPVVATESVRVPLEEGFRVTVNAIYR